ncbi:hypothetical protein ABFS83_02G098700 [Erythranthe nasuta]
MDNVSGADDQYFLVHFIMGTYFGPDINGCKPDKSALQRRAENLPQYNANDLAGSSIKTTLLESVYYYILRKAEQSLVLKQPFLLQYINGGTLPNSAAATYPKFDDLFPCKLHTNRSQFTIDNIVFINNPEIYYIKPHDIERFKMLTGLGDLLVDRESAMLHIFEDESATLYNVKVQETSSNVDLQYVKYFPCGNTYLDVVGNEESNSACNVGHSSIVVSESEEGVDQGMIFLPSCPSREEWSNLAANIKCGFALTGSAARGHLGPVLGLMDIGESEDSYLFRVSLPGVKRDERDFRCEVESDGTVMIKGVTVSGERVVKKYAQVFEMQTQNLCPPGHFSISFKLPGPVDPLQFHGTFATDGILEGIALKPTY